MVVPITTTIDIGTKKQLDELKKAGYSVGAVIRMGIDKIRGMPAILERQNELEIENKKQQKAILIMQKRIFDMEMEANKNG